MIDRECKRCHAPFFDPDHPVLSMETAVACEACHGPGSVYSSLAVMIDPLKRLEAGLRDGQQSCQGCHAPEHADHIEIDLIEESRRVHPAPALRRAPH